VKNRILLIILLVLLVAGAYFGLTKYQQSRKAPAGKYYVIRVVDGDTIEVDMDGTTEKVRLIGVDTPETHHPDKGVECFGQLASDYTKAALEGRTVRLESDETNQNRDRYQRLLRYVYTDQGELWNARLLQDGYAHALTAFPFTKMADFKLYEQNAKATSKGLWSSCN
jgi:micrococcal nuclease